MTVRHKTMYGLFLSFLVCALSSHHLYWTCSQDGVSVKIFPSVGEKMCWRYVQCPLLTLDEKIPDLGDLRVGAFFNWTGHRAPAGGQKYSDQCQTFQN